MADGGHFNFSTQFDGTIEKYNPTISATIAYNGPGAVSNISVDGQTATFATSAGNYTLNFAADLDPSKFVLDAATGTIIVCLVTGTLVRTTRGDIPVEALRVEDIAFTASSPHSMDRKYRVRLPQRQGSPGMLADPYCSGSPWAE